MVEGGEQARRDLWPWQKEVLATVEAAIVEKQAGARPRLERVLRWGEVWLWGGVGWGWGMCGGGD